MAASAAGLPSVSRPQEGVGGIGGQTARRKVPCPIAVEPSRAVRLRAGLDELGLGHVQGEARREQDEAVHRTLLPGPSGDKRINGRCSRSL